MGQAVGTRTGKSNYQNNQDSIIPFVKDNELLAAAAKAQAIKLSWLVSRTPVGHEEDACWARSSGFSLNVLFVCASLGHLEELMTVYNAWHETRWWEDRLAPSECKWNQWDPGTPLACAVNEGHVQVARFLMEKCGQRPESWCTLDGKKVTALHLCVQKQLLELIDPILQSVGDLKRRVDLLGMRDGTVTSPLGVAMRSNNMELIRLLVNEKWGGNEFIEALDDQQQPIAVYCGSEEARPDVLEYLCHVFHKGLSHAFVNATQCPHWSATNRELLDILVNHPNFPDCIKSESTPERAPTPLFVAILRNHQDLALKFLSLGANPNAPCTHQLGNYRDEFTPMILAVILNRSELVTEMVKLGGVLPSEECDIWKHHKGSEYDHIHGYLELFRHRTGVNPSLSVVDYSTVASSTDMLRASMPVMKFEKLTPNGVSETPQMVSAFVGIDDAITANAALYKAETAGVFALLDIQSLGRIQQTSRFWYHVARSNSCWKQALLNSSATWQDDTRTVLRHFLSLMEIESDQTKWKHVSFVWMSRNYCTGCGHAYRCCDGTQCTENRPRLMHHSAIEYSVLNNYCKAYETAYNAWHESLCWEDCFVHYVCQWKQLDEEDPFASAVYTGHVHVARFLLKKGYLWATTLHLCVQKQLTDLIDFILQSASGLERRVELLGMRNRTVTSPLEVAMYSGNMELIRLLVNEKWGGIQFIEALEDQQQPIAKYCDWEKARPDVLQFLCQLFHKRLETADVKPLYRAILRNNQDLAMMLLSLGANPNASFRYGRLPGDNSFFALMEFTPMTFAVVLNRSELVTEMGKLGGLLPEDCDLWRHFLEQGFRHIHGYLESRRLRVRRHVPVSDYSQILGSTDMLRASLPVIKLEKLAPNGVSEIPQMISASVDCDDTITSNASLCQAEAVGVLTFLDVQSLGRMQRTSRFWYQSGSSNSCWKQALLNSQVAWTENRTRQVFTHFLNFIELIDQIEWKHVSFLWMSQNYCVKCEHVFHRFRGTRCQIGGESGTVASRFKHYCAIEHSLLDRYYEAYDRAWCLEYKEGW